MVMAFKSHLFKRGHFHFLLSEFYPPKNSIGKIRNDLYVQNERREFKNKIYVFDTAP
jgi:hypothetical protein